MPDPAPTAGNALPIRDAASVVVVRRGPGAGPEVLMGQRGATAAFMPDKFVFPGGAVDADDLAVDHFGSTDPETAQRLAIETPPGVARALPLCAIRELWEETGLLLGRHDALAEAAAPDAPIGWKGFLARGVVPWAAGLRFFFRAVTPAGRPRRFDARFFMCEARDLVPVSEEFTFATGELRHLQWLEIAAARSLPLPFITEVVLSEVAARLERPDLPRPVPYFHHPADGALFRLL